MDTERFWMWICRRGRSQREIWIPNLHRNLWAEWGSLVSFFTLVDSSVECEGNRGLCPGKGEEKNLSRRDNEIVTEQKQLEKGCYG
jgi:hypothetical protein